MAESANQGEEDFDSRIPGGGSTYFYRRRDTKLPDGSTRKQIWCLGAGGMAATFDGIKNEGGLRKPVAIKQVALPKDAAEKLEAYEFRGLQALSGRDHPNIVKFITFFKGDDGDGRVRLSFVFERCPTVVPYLVEAVTNPKGFVVASDDLVQPERDGCDLVVNPFRKPPLTLREALHVIRQLLRAVAYLHSAYPPIIHRDIKPDNTLIWGGRPDPATGELLLEVKITDYGTVRRADRRDLTLGQGTRSFMAPEVEVQTGTGKSTPTTTSSSSSSGRMGMGMGMGMQGSGSSAAAEPPKPTAQYDQSVDVFSVGATFFYLLSSQAPHSNTRLPWTTRFGGDTVVELARMRKWAARRDEKRAEDKARYERRAARAAAAAAAAAGASAGAPAGSEQASASASGGPQPSPTGSAVSSSTAGASSSVAGGGSSLPPGPTLHTEAADAGEARVLPRIETPIAGHGPTFLVVGAGGRLIDTSAVAGTTASSAANSAPSSAPPSAAPSRKESVDGSAGGAGAASAAAAAAATTAAAGTGEASVPQVAEKLAGLAVSGGHAHSASGSTATGQGQGQSQQQGVGLWDRPPSAPGSSSGHATSSSSSGAVPSDGSAAGTTTILDFVFPTGSPQRVFLEGMIVAAPASSSASSAAAAAAPAAEGQAGGKRWTAAEALAWLDATWPQIKEGRPL